MRLISLLLISIFCFVMLNCNSKKHKVEIKESASVQDTMVETVKNVPIKQNSLRRKEDSLAKLIVKDTINPSLKVVIDGKLYYKKNIGDWTWPENELHSRAHYLYIYRDVQLGKDYDIRTGKYSYGPSIFSTGVSETDQ